ncbi:MAG: hypothetical protein K2K80_00045 [Clostridia bacterium]|nr:hypothetical protein [Clostridia bacterium]
MKKFLFIFISVVFAVSFSGCFRRCYPEKEELIPSSLGKAEDFWLYKGNLRSRTDGTEEELLFTEFTYEENRYSVEQLYLWDYYYATPTHKIFFLYMTDDRTEFFLYMYDYAEKSGQCLQSFTEWPRIFFGSILYIVLDETKLAYDLNGNLIGGEEFEFGDGDDPIYLLYEANYKNDFYYSIYRKARNANENAYIEWWYNGEIHTAAIPVYHFTNKEATEQYIYLIASQIVYAVNRETGEVSRHDLSVVTYSSNKYIDAYRNIESIYFEDGAAYFFSCVYYYKNEDDTDWKYCLHKIKGNEFTQVAEFNSKQREAEMRKDGDFFYFQIETGLFSGTYTYYRYNLKSGQLKKVARKYFRGEKVGDIGSAIQKKKVGEYAFYITSKSYGFGEMGWFEGGRCYYLNREHNEVTEVMQYRFDSKYFFDDICEF